MQLPKNLLSGLYTKPDVFLCETDKTKICKLETLDLKGTFKFNSYSEISLGVSRLYTDLITGETMVCPYYNKIEALRLLYIPGFGYFEIQDPDINSDGIQEIKNINAFSLEYSLSQKYLDDFVINTPDNEMNIGGGTPSSNIEDPLVQLYNPLDVEHSLLHLVLQKAYGWTIGHVDQSLRTQTRSFEIDRSSIYDFLVNDISESFKCYFVFDTVNNTINVYADTISAKFYGDGQTKKFILPQVFSTVGSVTVNGYKTLEYSYNNETGEIDFTSAPENLSIIEVEDGSLSMWETDVFVSFNNLAQNMKINYSADDIKTVLKVTGSDDMDIRNVNMGQDYIMDLSYYHTVDWMGQDLYDAYKRYLDLINAQTVRYTPLLKSINDLYDEYFELQNRTSTDLTVLKLDHFKTMLQFYYKNKTIVGGEIDSSTIEETIIQDFAFIDGNVVSDYLNILKNESSSIDTVEQKTYEILSLILNQYGSNMLQTRVDAYTKVQEVHIDGGWSVNTNSNYYMYWANYIMLMGSQKALDDRNNELKLVQVNINNINDQIQAITDLVAMENNFTEKQLIRLSAFMREDEYSDSNFIITDNETNADIIKSQKELLQCGKIELDHLCKPKLSFSTTMANIYALPEFEPIVHKFQLGNMIRISLRPDYIRRSRIMQVDINFDDFSDFSVTFGDLISTKSQIDIHADLLKQAANAGKSVASNSTYWDKGADMATKTDIKLQNGLLDANQKIKATDGTQGVEIDKYGIKN